MARIKMITRTIEFTNVNVMYVNTETAEVTIAAKMLTGDFKNEDDIKKYLNEHDIVGDFIAVKVTIIGTEEKLFGMPETEFIKYAQPLPNRLSTK